MATDISGKTFDPRHNYSELVSMQGRVVSDTPLNENAAIIDRRFRAETIDLAGFCGYPAHIPDSFRIEIAGGSLLIHPGRYYVDGLLAENFGHGDHAFYLPLEEERSDEPVPYQSQPYLPNITPSTLENGRYLVFLDVWKRPITFLEDPTLIDPAIGVDTSARIQTVWQVKLFPVSNDVTCNTDDEDIAGWQALTAASSARLTTRANPTSAVDDPCLLPPEGGYRGLENRTYMVSVHDVNDDGVPLLKWSRVNGAFAGRILAQPANNTLTLEQVAKDDYLRFSPGDWAEITDDVRVLNGQPGTMVRVLSVNDASNTVVLDAPLAAGVVPLLPASTAADQNVHPILRRWDQSGAVVNTDGDPITNLDAPGSNGLIPAPEGTFLVLEDGVEVAIFLEGGVGEYHLGDNWSFITRYADSSVEILTASPPQLLHHHYCRLAFVDVANRQFIAPVFQDCREPIGTIGCCTVVVRPGEDIQAALDSLSPEFGGCVCLKVGVHRLFRPLRIRHPNVMLHGESHGAQLLNLSNDAAIDVRSDSGAVLRGIHISTLRIVNRGGMLKPSGVISLRDVADSVVEQCQISFVIETSQSFDIPAIGLYDCWRVKVADCSITDATIGVWMDDNGGDLVVRDNVFEAVIKNHNGLIGVAVANLTGRVLVIDNDISGFLRGVVVNNEPLGRAFSTAAHTQVKGNRITLNNRFGKQDAIAIECHCPQGVLSENQIVLQAEDSTGIAASGLGSLIERNRIEAGEGAEIQVAVLLDGSTDSFTAGLTVAQNWIRGCSGGVIAENVAGLRIDSNDISSDGRGNDMAVSVTECEVVSIENNLIVSLTVPVFANQCEDVQIISNQIRENSMSIACQQCMRVDISHNQISHCDSGGIFLISCQARAAIVGNQINYVGTAAKGVFASSILSIFHLGECHVESNEVLNTGVSEKGEINPQRTVGICALYVLEARVESNLVSYSDLMTRERIIDDRALLLQGLYEVSIIVGEDPFILLGYSAQISNNKFLGRGPDTLVEILSRSFSKNVRARFERVFFTNNFIEHVGRNPDQVAKNATVILQGFQATVSGNQVKSGTRFLPSFDFKNMDGPFIGNITTGRVVNHVEFPVPENAFNTRV
ncbi:DUF6519 domain-containing protein [Veronia pacifica]|uniref:Periplasmic copper-binding protein NosD beta helix domain-containing protein n=1 Tax=Veronia pacifica TaxID=1080227 RepID=A0A1C3EPM2_9GAMM|nr:DUF6519 domain-containing protein [Veronia pacifica]ODA35166.1 hypothetical protein A8L45_04425 [Veronia pacifica]